MKSWLQRSAMFSAVVLAFLPLIELASPAVSRAQPPPCPPGMYWNFDTVACQYPPPPVVYVDPWLPVYIPDIVDADIDLDVDIPVPRPPDIGAPGRGDIGASRTSTPGRWAWRWTWRWATLGHRTKAALPGKRPIQQFHTDESHSDHGSTRGLPAKIVGSRYVALPGAESESTGRRNRPGGSMLPRAGPPPELPILTSSASKRGSRAWVGQGRVRPP